VAGEGGKGEVVGFRVGDSRSSRTKVVGQGRWGVPQVEVSEGVSSVVVRSVVTSSPDRQMSPVVD
jgi:hypothetical protein